MTFESLLSDDRIIEAIGYMGFVTPTPIQQQAIPIILDQSDLIACAQTGTGKTAAFLLPIMELIRNDYDESETTKVLVLVPTRELALQIDQQLEGLAYSLSINSLAVYGGGDGGNWDQQKKALSKGADIIVATPGRLLSHINMGYVKLKDVKCLVLDEADRMLDMGFFEDIKSIVKELPKQRQTLLFSATMPDNIRKLSATILHHPKQISISISKPAEGVLQTAYLLHDQQKIPLLTHLLKGKDNYNKVIIFSSTKKNVEEIAKNLKKAGLSVGYISSDLEQSVRERVLMEFRSNQLRIIVATDVLARGIDIKEIELVINFDVPRDAEDYVHRVGRTARAETTGESITLINERDINSFMKIESMIGTEIQKIPMPKGLENNLKYVPTKFVKQRNTNFKPKTTGRR